MTARELPLRLVRAANRSVNGISFRRRPKLVGAISQPCTFEQVLSAEYEEWCRRLRTPRLHHRKTWEWVYIMQVLEEHDMLRPGRRGLGFGVGVEPITPYAASRGAEILATDLPTGGPRVGEWTESGQHADEHVDLNRDGLCPDDLFRANVTFRAVDMRHIPDDLRSFDFAWSSCAMEHLGSLEAGTEFLERHLACLRPGGVGVHTTEYNVDPDGPTLSEFFTVLYQRPQLEELVRAMRRRGHRMKITFATGTQPEDLHVDKHPHTNTHIRTETLGYIHTSFGLVVQKGR